MRSCWLRSVTWVQKASTLHPSSSMRRMISPRPLRSCFWSSTCVKMLASSWQVLRSQLIWSVPSWMPWRLIFRNYHLSFLQGSTHKGALMKQLHSWGVELQLDAKFVLFTPSSRCWRGCTRSLDPEEERVDVHGKVDHNKLVTLYELRWRSSCWQGLPTTDDMFVSFLPLGTWSKVTNIYFSNGLKPPVSWFLKDDFKSIFAIPWDECIITYIYLTNKTSTIDELIKIPISLILWV